MSDYIPFIIYINLEKRLDRRNQIESELIKYELPFMRFNAIYKTGGVGCTESHLEVLKLAKLNKLKSVLIMEDDFTFLIEQEEFRNEMKCLHNSGIKYDVCMLAYNLLNSTNYDNYSNVGKILDAQTASSYIVNEHYYDVLIDLFEKNLPLLISTGQHWNYMNDQCWKVLQAKDNWIYTKTRIGKQRDGYSDNVGKYVNYEV